MSPKLMNGVARSFVRSRDLKNEPQQHLQTNSSKHLQGSKFELNALTTTISRANSKDTVQRISTVDPMRGICNFTRLSIVTASGLVGCVVGGIAGSIPIAGKVAAARRKSDEPKPGALDFLMACYQCGLLTGLSTAWQAALLLYSEEQLSELIDTL